MNPKKMKKEDQYTEYKESWRDEYLKWVCAFANANGGRQVTFMKNIYTEEYLKKMGLNERQIKAILHIKTNGQITSGIYSTENKITDRTALRDLNELIAKKIIYKTGGKRGAKYFLK